MYIWHMSDTKKQQQQTSFRLNEQTNSEEEDDEEEEDLFKKHPSAAGLRQRKPHATQVIDDEEDDEDDFAGPKDNSNHLIRDFRRANGMYSDTTSDDAESLRMNELRSFSPESGASASSPSSESEGQLPDGFGHYNNGSSGSTSNEGFTRLRRHPQATQATTANSARSGGAASSTARRTTSDAVLEDGQKGALYGPFTKDGTLTGGFPYLVNRGMSTHPPVDKEPEQPAHTCVRCKKPFAAAINQKRCTAGHQSGKGNIHKPAVGKLPGLENEEAWIAVWDSFSNETKARIVNVAMDPVGERLLNGLGTLCVVLLLLHIARCSAFNTIGSRTI